ncbi:MAG: potassium channel protein [Planctomycetes bacterium]|nr:potassium channel protein [Planctomycetota bacterium]
MTRASLFPAYRRLLVPALFVLAIVVVGATGYRLLGGDRWTWGECFYMTVITLSTVGYSEVLDGLREVGGGRVWTVTLILLGSGALLYFLSTVTAMFVEGDLGGALRRRRMQREIDALDNHVIVCGAGTTGIHVIEELAQSRAPFVVIDVDGERLQRLAEESIPGLRYLVGDAAEDAVLERAGIARARGVVSALSDDRSNLFVTVTSRALNPKLRIVAKAVEHSTVPKLRRAGADAVVSPNQIGALRLVGEMLRPRVVGFLDSTLREKDASLRIEELVIDERSPLLGRALGDTPLARSTEVSVIALQDPDGRFRLAPPPETRLEAGSALIVLGRTAELARALQPLAPSGSN